MARLNVINRVIFCMKKYLILLFIIVSGFTDGDVQRELITLNWNKSVFLGVEKPNTPYLYFENADYCDSGSKIPVYGRVYSLKNSFREVKFLVENCVFEEIKLPEDYSDFQEIEDEIKITTTKLNSGRTQKVQLQIIPLKKEDGRFFVLKSFELKQVPVTVKSAKKEIINWKTESVLKSGNWVKISTDTKGIYKIPYSKLNEWGFTNPANVNVFGSGGTILSENPGIINFDDLPQNAVWHGRNNGVDCLFFYAPGTTEWKLNASAQLFEHQLNDYATKGFFFLTENVGTVKIIEQLDEIQETATNTINSFDAYDFSENELENILPLGSGKIWFGEKFKNSSVKNVIFNIKNIENPSNVAVRVNAVARSYQKSEMNVLVNQVTAGSLNFLSVNTGSQTENYANEKDGVFVAEASGDQITVGLKYFAGIVENTVDENAVAWLNFVEINYRKNLKRGDVPLFFRDLSSLGENNIVEFSIDNCSSETKVFDVTEYYNVKQIPLELNGNIAKGKRPADQLQEYVVFNINGSFSEPEFVGEVQNQNLHALKTPEFVIITHQSFINSANKLADFHRAHDGMNVEVVVDNAVYNEFSSGTKNATGIRNFIKMLYDRGNTLKYVLLFGDGSFDNKNIRTETRNFIPTFQSANSLSPVGSFVTDDYFVILDADESVYNGAVDLGIGRIPASTTFEAELVVEKILNYYNPEAFGEWRNTVCFIGDDGDGGLHLSDSEKLANYVNKNHKEFITDKIYFDAYPVEATPAGKRYPDVTNAINNRVKDGVLILNYVGHANERFMADEHVLDVSHVNSWSNAGNLPIFVTATCEFSRFDADDTSIGEYVLLNPNGGGIGLFSTTRLVYAYSNSLLSQSFYSFVFETDENGNRYRMGDIMRLAKINTINTTNKRNFTLLADPALKLSYPENKVITTSINGRDANNSSDTIGALQRIDINGFVSDYFGSKLNDFSGEILVTVYDKAVTMRTLGNSGGTPMTFNVQENIIYKGKANVTNGDFSFSFVVPKDISYNLGKGKIIYYATDDASDAHGAFENFVIGGSSNGNIVDNKGPQIDLFMDASSFISGDKTGKNPSLVAYLTDENGINTVGTGIGHDITAVLDEDYSNVLVLNRYYQSNLNDYTSGTVVFPFQNLSVGKHKLKLKAWDVANNSSEVEIEFEVSGDFYISEVATYPNPAMDYTFFTFKHNQSGAMLDVLIEVFDVMGRRIDYISQEVGSNGTSSNPVRWDFYENKIQMRSGIYIYRVSAKNSDGVIAFQSGKIMVSK